MSLVVGALTGLAVAAVAGTRGRRARAAPPQRSAGTVVGARRPGGGLSERLLGVSAQLRAGATPAQAWSRVLGTVADGPVPAAAALLGATVPPRRGPIRRRARDGDVQRVRAVLAAAHVSDQLGAPLAGVLERIAAAVAADEEAEGARRAALAGPRSTAQVLAWLPLLGVALGALLGADPVGVVFSGGLGTASAVLGVTLLLAGRWWTSALLSRAGRAGAVGPVVRRTRTVARR
ncbi:type II secretion protein F [Cellulomonas humilata]|uniref:Type II secretion protein F n=1 Tax=Cellulomonas humilata TaxID=144055 RepID=A0A7Y6A0B4_9CELL|nr:type II secretion protein F [Cellulomonas humilata]NUU16084.1 type II secretion protein F [Cellulomonas humilata]